MENKQNEAGGKQEFRDVLKKISEDKGLASLIKLGENIKEKMKVIENNNEIKK